MKVHKLTPDPTAGKHDWRTTLCGREGTLDWGDEYDTATDERFEAVADNKRVTCRACRRSRRWGDE